MSDTTQPTVTDNKITVSADKPADSNNGDATGGESSKGGDKLFSQAELDAIVKERLTRAEQKALAAEAKAKADAAADALKEQGDFKKLTETQAETLKTLTTERDALVAERDTLQTQAGKYEKSLRAMLEAQKAGIPEHVKPLLDKLPIDEQFDWIAANQGQIKVNGVPFTPKPDGAGLNAAQKEAVQKQTDRDYRRSF